MGGVFSGTGSGYWSGVIVGWGRTGSGRWCGPDLDRGGIKAAAGLGWDGPGLGRGRS